MSVIEIDIVSDVVCPWCAVGYGNLKHAIEELGDQCDVKIRWRAFELNPHMGSDGQEIVEHLMEKYKIDEAQVKANKERLIQVGQEAGIEFKFEQRSRIYNTFDSHRLLHWADVTAPEQQTPLKEALFLAYFNRGEDISNHEVLLEIVAGVGLPVNEAKDILESDRYEQDVRTEQSQYQQMGIQAVPAFIINQKYLINGGQPKAAFIEALTQVNHEQSV